MSIVVENDKPRPFSAGVTKLYKVRPLSSNCPTIVKHQISPLMENFQAFADPSDIKSSRDRPRTALSTSKKFKFEGAVLNPSSTVRNLLSPISRGSIRPSSAPYNSFVNFEFIQSIGKDKTKYEDKSNIKPLKKLKTEQFHTIIYKVKQQKELIEQKITYLEEWQKEMNRNDVWNTPQAAIVDGILEVSAKTNPDGVVNEYLRREKEKEEEKKFRRKIMRPSSSLGPNGRSIKTAKSVTDFFRDYDKEDLIQDILASPKDSYAVSYMSSKKEIKEKINDYLDNMNNYRTLIEGSKDIMQSHRNGIMSEMYETFPVAEEAELEQERDRGLTIDTNLDSKNYDINNIPMSQTVRKGFQLDPSFLRTTTKSTLVSPKGVVVIHSRPQTAKRSSNNSTPNLLTKDFVTMRDTREKFLGSLSNLTTMSSPKDGPLSLSGSRVIIRPFKEMYTKTNKKIQPEIHKKESRDFTLEQRVREIKSQEIMEQKQPLSRPRTAASQKQSQVEFRPMSAKESDVRKRLQSAKGGRDKGEKATIATQTFDNRPDSGVNKIYIDGEYFNAYSYPMDPELYEKAKKNVLKSWISNEHHPGSQPDGEYIDGDSQSLS